LLFVSKGLQYLQLKEKKVFLTITIFIALWRGFFNEHFSH